MTHSSATAYVVSDRIDVLAARYKDQRFSPHFHETYTFGVIVKGECHFECSRRSWIAREGDLFVIHPYELHTGGTALGSVQYSAIYPKFRWLQQFPPFGSPSELPYFPSAVYKDDPDIDLFRKVVQAIRHGEKPQQATQLRLVERLLTAITARYSAGIQSLQGQKQLDIRIDLACRLSQEHWREDIGSSTLASKVGLSRFHFIRLFRENIGMTPRAYTRNIRLIQAKRLIHAGTSLAEVASATRFSDQSHLTREFKRVYGTSPGALTAWPDSNCVQDDPPHSY